MVFIHRWNPNRLTDLPIILCVGPRDSGKTTLAFSLLHALRDKFDLVFAFCGSKDTEQQIEAVNPKAFIYPEFSEDTVNTMYEMAETCKIRKSRERTFLIYLDDLTYDKHFMQKKVLQRVFMNGRHDNMALIICAQYVMDIPRSQREQIEFVFVFETSNIGTKNRLFNEFFAVFGKKQFTLFERTLESCTKNFECLVLDKGRNSRMRRSSQNSGSIANSVFFYKAPFPIPSFKLCKPHFWELSRTFERSLEHRTRTKERELFQLGNPYRDPDGGVSNVVHKCDENGSPL